MTQDKDYSEILKEYRKEFGGDVDRFMDGEKLALSYNGSLEDSFEAFLIKALKTIEEKE